MDEGVTKGGHFEKGVTPVQGGCATRLQEGGRRALPERRGRPSSAGSTTRGGCKVARLGGRACLGRIGGEIDRMRQAAE